MSNLDQFGPCSPFFTVKDVTASLRHYVEQLGFECRYAEPKDAPFFAIVGRGAAQVMLKDVGVDPMPNHVRHADAPWDAFVYVGDPDAVAREFGGRGVGFRAPLGDREDGLRGFSVVDPDGYVCFFGRPN